MNSNWLFSSNFASDISGFFGLFTDSMTHEQLGYFLITYCLVSAVLALFIWLLLPHKYRFPMLRSYVFLYSIICFIPFLGIIGLIVFVLPSLYYPQVRKARILEIQEEIQLPYAQLEMQETSLFNDGGLQDVMNLQTNDAKRLKAMLSIRNMSKQDAIPILKRALRDPADDIRLLAYAMLDRYETQINTELEGVQSQLADATGAHKAELHKHIALNYWELAYLGLAQGAVLEHALDQAQKNIQQAMAFKETPELAMLAGRIALKQKRSEFASLAFKQAIAVGMDKQHVLPYLAEAAYMSGHYQKIPYLLEQLPEALRHRYPFSELVDYWHVNTNRT